MAYLTKQERYDELLNLAIAIAREEGLSAITARKIATKGGIAVGQVHHHFQSISQLKALALKLVSDQLIAESAVELQTQNVFDRLINIICPIEGDIGNIMRKLWSEAQFLAEQDAEIQKAYKQSIDEWYQTILQLVIEGDQQSVFKVNNPEEMTWILIAVSCGFDSISVVEDFRFEKDILRRHIERILNVNNAYIFEHAEIGDGKDL